MKVLFDEMKKFHSYFKLMCRHHHRAGKAAGCFVVAIPDSRFTEDEKSIFREEADVVLDDLTKFDGSIFGIPIDLKEA